MLYASTFVLSFQPYFIESLWKKTTTIPRKVLDKNIVLGSISWFRNTFLHALFDVIIGITVYVSIAKTIPVYGIIIGAMLEFVIAFGFEKIFSNKRKRFILILSSITVTIGIVVGTVFQNIWLGASIEGVSIMVVRILSEYQQIKKFTKTKRKYMQKKRSRTKNWWVTYKYISGLFIFSINSQMPHSANSLFRTASFSFFTFFVSLKASFSW